ncbi:hypothetical protein C8Q76DRAFT_860399 [Earliella scabrosa]|nr:hypothetical protein C8Q76DRAFT_860399 [Earliella scabrosa]
MAQGWKDQAKPVEERYIHDFSIVDDVPVITTFLPKLAERLHNARVLLHDNTYKRIAGKGYIEWETVIWCDDIDMRVTIARSYCSRERRPDFLRIIESFYNAVERVTGRPLQLKAFSAPGQGGILAILVDCCQAQMDALGDFFLKYNKPSISGISETDPQKLVEYLVKVCSVHFDRNVTELSHKCDCSETIARVQALPHLRTREELQDFFKFCENSPENLKALRDWYTNKKGMPWFWGVINRHFSKMPDRDWLSTPNNTNINESAHTLTNAYTGTGLSIFEGILRAEEFDKHQLATIEATEASGIRHNRHNTPAKRMQANAIRQAARNAKSLASSEAQKKKKSRRAGKSKIQSHPCDALDDESYHDHIPDHADAIGPPSSEDLTPYGCDADLGSGTYYPEHASDSSLQQRIALESGASSSTLQGRTDVVGDWNQFSWWPPVPHIPEPAVLPDFTVDYDPLEVVLPYTRAHTPLDAEQMYHMTGIWNE